MGKIDGLYPSGLETSPPSFEPLFEGVLINVVHVVSVAHGCLHSPCIIDDIPCSSHRISVLYVGGKREITPTRR